MKNRLYYIPLILLPIIGIVIGSFFDLQIARSIYLPNNIFSLLMASIGEIPLNGGLAFISGLSIFYVLRKWDCKWKKITIITIFALVFLFMTFIQGKAICDINGFGAIAPKLNELRYPLSIPLGLVITLPFFLLGMKQEKRVENSNIIKIFLVVLIGFAISYLIVTIIKGIMSRPRFRIMEIYGENIFTNWWQFFEEKEIYIALGEAGENFKSFPSGHTNTSILMMICLIYLPYVFKGKNNRVLQAFLLSFAWIILMAFSRMLCGAHFLSDVSFGCLFSTVFLLISNEIAIRTKLI